MHLAALIDLVVPEELLRAELSKLGLDSEFSLTISRRHKSGIHGMHVDVEPKSETERNERDILELVNTADLSDKVKAIATSLVASIAIAESKIHQIERDQVHFHEVGAVDSIVDLVGAAICLDHLAPEHIICSPPELGGGFVTCQHGKIPVPAPATLEILEGVPCFFGGVNGECTTPSGASILKNVVDEFQPRGLFSSLQTGYGIGTKDFEVPNVLRISIGEYEHPELRNSSPEHTKIEANIDDMNPEQYEPLIDALFSAGADDVYILPMIMKKSRPANCLTVLCPSHKTKGLSEIILNQSSTIGVREIPFQKVVLPREIRNIETSLGSVRVKIVSQPNGASRWKVEHDDLLFLTQSNTTQTKDYAAIKLQVDREVDQILSRE